MKIPMIARFVIGVAVAIVLRPLFVDDTEYIEASMLASLGFVVIFALIEGNVKK